MSRAFHATPSRPIQSRSSRSSRNISETGPQTPLLDDVDGGNELDTSVGRKAQSQSLCCGKIMGIFSFQWTPHNLAARRRRRALFLSYLPDWYVVIMLLVRVCVPTYHTGCFPLFWREFTSSPKIVSLTHQRTQCCILFAG